MFLLRMLTRNRARKMDPLHVSMTGVRMGEHVLQIGCSDRALLSGLASKVGLSGTAMVATFDEDEEDRVDGVAKRIGALIERQPVARGILPFESDLFDMVVIDDTRGRFAGLAEDTRLELLREARRVVRRGGRIDIVEGAATRPTGYDALRDLTAAGFNPSRLLAEREGFRFLEGLKAA
jgi:hypothetical protein